ARSRPGGAWCPAASQHHSRYPCSRGGQNAAHQYCGHCVEVLEANNAPFSQLQLALSVSGASKTVTARREARTASPFGPPWVALSQLCNPLLIPKTPALLHDFL